jgi:hypothetical protein
MPGRKKRRQVHKLGIIHESVSSTQRHQNVLALVQVSLGL